MFDKQLKPYFEGRVLANESAMKDPAIIAALHSMAKRDFAPQEINNHGIWYISDRH